MNRRDVLAAARARLLLASGEARRIRERAGASRRDVASAIGATPSAVGHWESGIRRPRSATAARYGELLAELAELAAAEDQ
jgi:transcriptional regulator with XRE-family HTH domain